MQREYPTAPIASVGVAVWKDGKILLARRAKEPSKGFWTLPGGVQELGETVAETAAREIMEEIGIEIEVLRVIDIVDALRHDDAGRVQYHYTIIEVAANWVSGEAQPLEDTDGIIWADPEDLTGIEPMTDRTAEIIAQARDNICPPTTTD